MPIRWLLVEGIKVKGLFLEFRARIPRAVTGSVTSRMSKYFDIRIQVIVAE